MTNSKEFFDETLEKVFADLGRTKDFLLTNEICSISLVRSYAIADLHNVLKETHVRWTDEPKENRRFEAIITQLCAEIAVLKALAECLMDKIEYSTT